MYSSWGTHTPSLNLIGPGSLDVSCLRAQFPKKTKIAIFLSFDTKRPWICTKNNRVHVLIMGNTHTKFKLDRTRQSGLIVFTRKISQNFTKSPKLQCPYVLTKKDLGSARKTIGFMYSSWGTHTPSLNLIGLGSLDLSCLRAQFHNISQNLPFC